MVTLCSMCDKLTSRLNYATVIHVLRVTLCLNETELSGGGVCTRMKV